MGQTVSGRMEQQSLEIMTATQAVNEDALPATAGGERVPSRDATSYSPILILFSVVVLMVLISTGALTPTVEVVVAFLPICCCACMCRCVYADMRGYPLLRGSQQRNATSQVEGYRARVAMLGDREKRRTLFHYFYFVPRPRSEESADREGRGCGSSESKTGLDADEVDEAAAGSCIICLGDFSSREELCRLPCLHLYHAKCIDEWLDGANHHWCPLCKTDVITEAASTPPASGGTTSTTCTTTPTNPNPAGGHDAV